MDFRAIVMGVTFAFIWASAFTSARVIVAAMPPVWALSIRFLISAAVALAIARAMGQSWRVARGQWPAVVLFGLCQNALYLGLNFVAMTRVEASMAAILASTMPLIVAFLAWAWKGERLATQAVLGLVAGVAGVALIMGSRISGGADPMGIGLCILGALALAVATLTIHGAAAGGNLMAVVGWQMFVGSVVLLPFAILGGPLTVHWSWGLVVAFAYTVLLPGVLATWLWFALVGRIGPTRAATFHFLNPFFGVAVAALLLGEALHWIDALGVTVIAAGILAVQLARARPAAAPVPNTES